MLFTNNQAEYSLIMNNDSIKFHSVVATQMESFLIECLTLHRDVINITRVLKEFDEFLVKNKVQNERLTTEIYDKWTNTFKDALSTKTTIQRCSYIVWFYEYLFRLGIQCIVPPPVKKKITSSFVPYVLTNEEVSRLFSVADEWRDKNLKPDSAVMAMPVLLRLLYSTGIRIGEALNIRNNDVNLDEHTIKILITKNNCERIAPINESLSQVLIQYLTFRNQLPAKDIDSPESFFLVNHRGHKLNQVTVLGRFHQLTKVAGIPNQNKKQGCRIHDLRHTACVHTMHKLVNMGYDLYNCLPAISAYMGHKSIFSTEKYLRLTVDRFPDVLKTDSGLKEIINNAYKQLDFEDDE